MFSVYLMLFGTLNQRCISVKCDVLQIILYLCGEAVLSGSVIATAEQQVTFLALRQMRGVRIADIMAPFPAMKARIKFEYLEPYLVDAQTEGQVL